MASYTRRQPPKISDALFQASVVFLQPQERSEAAEIHRNNTLPHLRGSWDATRPTSQNSSKQSLSLIRKPQKQTLDELPCLTFEAIDV